MCFLLLFVLVFAEDEALLYAESGGEKESKGWCKRRSLPLPPFTFSLFPSLSLSLLFLFRASNLLDYFCVVLWFCFHRFFFFARCPGVGQELYRREFEQCLTAWENPNPPPHIPPQRGIGGGGGRVPSRCGFGLWSMQLGGSSSVEIWMYNIQLKPCRVEEEAPN